MGKALRAISAKANNSEILGRANKACAAAAACHSDLSPLTTELQTRWEGVTRSELSAAFLDAINRFDESKLADSVTHTSTAWSAFEPWASHLTEEQQNTVRHFWDVALLALVQELRHSTAKDAVPGLLKLVQSLKETFCHHHQFLFLHDSPAKPFPNNKWVDTAIYFSSRAADWSFRLSLYSRPWAAWLPCKSPQTECAHPDHPQSSTPNDQDPQEHRSVSKKQNPSHTQ